MSDHDETTISLPIEFINALGHADSIEKVLRVSTDWLTRLIPSVRGSIALVDGDRILDHASRNDGITDPVYDTGTIIAGAPRSVAMKTCEPVFLNDDEMLATGSVPMRLFVASGLRSMLIVPMLAGDTAVGTLSVASHHRDSFDQRHARELTSIGCWIAAQAQLMQQLRNAARLAETDALTGLANRARLMRVLDGPGALHQPDADGRVVGVLHIDLDHFKEVNDSLGHAAGDTVLCHAARAMQAVLSPKDLLARVGGDEFVVVTRTDRRGRHIAELARRVAASVAQPLRIGKIHARIGVSIGTAMALDADSTGDRLIGNADIALYAVKHRGRGGIQAFSEDMRVAFDRRVQLLSDLAEAVKQQSFESYFQPQVSMATGHFSGFEMLARWPHPALGLVDPGDFIELAAEVGLSERIDSIVRTKGLAALRKLRSLGWHAPKMSFNASASTLSDPDLVKNLMIEVLREGLTPTDLVLEVREADLIKLGRNRAFDHVNALSQAGFGVELDDFGSGQAAISSLGRLSISAVKLDRSIITALPDGRSETIVRAIIAMAKELQLDVIAEGVETPAQFSLLRQLGCDIAQGFGVSKPLPLEGLVDFMQGYGKAPVRLAQAAPAQGVSSPPFPATSTS